MNERYVKARNTFERMMEESVAKHNPSGEFHILGYLLPVPLASSPFPSSPSCYLSLTNLNDLRCSSCGLRLLPTSNRT